MIDGRIDELAEQVHGLTREMRRLIRRERWWKRAACLTGVCVLVFAFAGAQRANVLKSVEAELFVLRDNEGRTRARLQTDPINKQPALVFADEHRKGPLLLHLDENGRPEIFLG
jgi:hypothetical protein